MLEAVWIGFAFVVGLFSRSLGLPTLVGYLAAGFVIAAASPYLSLPDHGQGIIEHVAHLGVLLLLFSVGLKLNARSLAKPEVLGVGLIHFVITVVVLFAVCTFVFELALYEAFIVAIALGFSSTVLAAKVLEGKRELGAFHGRVAIGIFIVQDLIALLAMTLAKGVTPSPFALLVFLLPFLRPVLYKLLDSIGHEDLLILFGLLLALVIGGYGFELVGLSLGNFSEFGLIVASVMVPEYLIPLALLVSLSFVVSAPLNAMAHPLYDRLSDYLVKFERNTRHLDEQPVKLGNADILIMGMGRTGSSAYSHLRETKKVIAMDADPFKVERHKAAGFHIFYADAEDRVFWEGLNFVSVQAVILCLNEVEANMTACRKLRKRGFPGLIIAHSLHDDEADKIIAAGADHAYLTMVEAGVGLAEHVKQRLEQV